MPNMTPAFDSIKKVLEETQQNSILKQMHGFIDLEEAEIVQQIRKCFKEVADKVEEKNTQSGWDALNKLITEIAKEDADFADKLEGMQANMHANNQHQLLLNALKSKELAAYFAKLLKDPANMTIPEKLKHLAKLRRDESAQVISSRVGQAGYGDEMSYFFWSILRLICNAVDELFVEAGFEPFYNNFENKAKSGKSSPPLIMMHK